MPQKTDTSKDLGKSTRKALRISKHSGNHFSHYENVFKSYYAVAVKVSAGEFFFGKSGYTRNIFS